MSTSYELDQELNNMAERELRGPATSSAPLRRAERTGPDTDDRNLAVATHIATIAAAIFSGGLLDIIVPAVAYVLFRDKSAFLKDHVKHQLNFQLTMLAVALVGVVFSTLTFGLGLLVVVPMVVLFFVVDVVCTIKAAIAASHGQDYEFPLAVPFLK